MKGFQVNNSYQNHYVSYTMNSKKNLRLSIHQNELHYNEFCSTTNCPHNFFIAYYKP